MKKFCTHSMQSSFFNTFFTHMSHSNVIQKGQLVYLGLGVKPRMHVC